MDVAETKVRAWDPLVKLTHWGIALAVLVNGVFTEEGSGWHVWVGTAMAALLGVRLLWGFIGPREARFSAFPPSPARAVAHVGDIVAGRKAAHEAAANLLFLLAALHIGGVLFETRRMGPAVIRRMTGGVRG